MIQKFLKIILTLCFTGCASSQIVLFNHSAPQISSEAPTLPENVSIYRTQHPYDSYTELGLITFQPTYFFLEDVYAQLRKDAAKQGADSIWDLKISGETHTEQSYERVCHQVTNCNPEGICSTADDCHDEIVSKEVSTYTVAGSLIKRKK